MNLNDCLLNWERFLMHYIRKRDILEEGEKAEYKCREEVRKQKKL